MTGLSEKKPAERRFTPDQFVPASKVDLTKLRPLKKGEFVDNLDGTRSTERTASFNIGGKEVLAPSIWMSPDGPVDLFKSPDLLAKVIKALKPGAKQSFPDLGQSGVRRICQRPLQWGGRLFWASCEANRGKRD